jgi:hypothetical protein
MKESCVMRVYGLDFTSSPSKAKRLTLAVCTFDGSTLKVEDLKLLNTNTDGDFSEFENWLNGRGDWSKEVTEWIAGIDFPFGLPIGSIAHFKWLSVAPQQDWQTWLFNMYASNPTLERFENRIEAWKRRNKKNEKDVSIHIKRQTDQIAGSTVSSPLKVRAHNPPVGNMFYKGAKPLQASGACIVPVRINDDKRRIVEAYPAIVANRFIGDQNYKGAKKKDRDRAAEARENIVKLLGTRNPYGIVVGFTKDDRRIETISDHDGDKLDSVLCAVQAAWSVTHNHGMPILTPQCLQDTIVLEGWIADPALLSHFE